MLTQAHVVLQASKEFVVMAQVEGKKWQKMLGHEHDQRVRLAEMVEQLAKQHSNLEEAAKAETAMVLSSMKLSAQQPSLGKHVPIGEEALSVIRYRDRSSVGLAYFSLIIVPSEDIIELTTHTHTHIVIFDTFFFSLTCRTLR
jgi:serine phosphatase RsbU (regulator of sigma subunit)